MARKKITTGTVRFNLRVDKTNKVQGSEKYGKAPIELIYSLHGQRKYLSTGITLYPFLWNAEEEQVEYMNKTEAKNLFPQHDYHLFPTYAEVSGMNNELSSLIHGIKNVEILLEASGIAYTSNDVTAKLKDQKQSSKVTKREDPKQYFADFMKERIPNLSAKRSKGTLQVYNSTLQHFQNFEAHKRKRYQIKDIDYSVLEGLDAFLLIGQPQEDGTIKQMQNSTIHKIIKTIKTFLNHAQELGMPTATNYRKYQIELKQHEPITLTQSEFDTLFSCELNEHLGRVRDVFVFACATGLRISDVKQFRREHIQGDNIVITQEKTDETVIIPINYYSHQVLEKYRNQLKPIPQLSEQYLNDSIKDVCKSAGINSQIEIHAYSGAKRTTTVVAKWSQITMHTARRTFVSLALSKGLDAETIRRWTGHKDLRSFAKYINIEQERRKELMQKAFGAPEQLSTLRKVT